MHPYQNRPLEQPHPAQVRVGDLHWGRWFVAWGLVGFGWALGLLAMLSIGLIPFAAATIGLVLLLRSDHAHLGLPGILAGPTAAALLIAYLNRGGPGTVCTGLKPPGVHQVPGDPPVHCTDMWNPAIFLAVAVVLLVVTVAAQALILKRARRLPR